MAEILKTNVCCLDLTKECIDYLKSLNLNVYEGSLGSVFSINWGKATYGAVPILDDVDIPDNLHEYHIVIHDMENPRIKEYSLYEHSIRVVENRKDRHLECRYPVNTLDIRPLGAQKLANHFLENNKGKRIEVVFVGRDSSVTYYTNEVDESSLRKEGSFSIDDCWNFVSWKNTHGQRVKFEDNSISKALFEGKLEYVKYYRVFYLPTVIEEGENRVDKHYISLLNNESGECVSYLYCNSDDYVKFVFPQTEDKVGLLKGLFEIVLFNAYSDYFPDILAHKWINNQSYMLPNEKEIQHLIDDKRSEYEQEIARLEEDKRAICEKNFFLKQLLTESGSTLVSAIKKYLEWLGFQSVINKDETLKDGDLKEEDICFDFEGNHIVMEVKGINGTSTDAECSQIDKVVSRRMRELGTTNVHGVYVVNHQRNIEPMKRGIPPFNETQIKDAESMSRTLVYTTQLFALYSDIENEYVTKDQAREALIQNGLALFHNHLQSIGVPYDYYQEDSVICLDFHDVKVCVGDTLFYKDHIHRLVGRKVVSLKQGEISFNEVSNGKTGVKVDGKVPRKKELFI